MATNEIEIDNNRMDNQEIELENSEIVFEENVIESISVNGVEQEVDENKNVDISVPTRTSDLSNDSNFVSDASYVHTDNNYTNAEKNKLASLENYDDTEITEDIEEMQTDIDNLKDGVLDLDRDKADKTEIPTKTSDLTNDNGFIDNSVNNLINYTLKTNTGSLIDLEINQSTYVITLNLKDQDGNVISTDNIDLPLESVVVGGTFDSTNKKIVLTLENGNTVDIPVGDLIAGLQTEITSSNKLASDLVDDSNSGNKFTNLTEKARWEAKYDKPNGGIPKTDLASDVQTSLGKADTALQEHQDLTDYVKNTDYATDSKGGVLKVRNDFGTQMVNGFLGSTVKDMTNYNNASPVIFISKGTLENVIEGKELVNETYVDNIVGDIESILEELDIGGGVA